ncbi:MAG TPA: HAMP domain-containing sensor histidine kinase [Acidobacteriota bacterium]|nr:HAMP domain-containing sensor histidine kinase [Acidobacteriota bacterium]
MRIRSRIWFGYLVVIFTLALALLLQNWALRDFMEATQEVQGGTVSPIALVGDIQSRLDLLNRRMKFYVAGAEFFLAPAYQELRKQPPDDPELAERLREQEEGVLQRGREVKQVVNELDRALERFSQEEVAQERRQAFEDIQVSWGLLKTSTTRTLDEVGGGDLPDAGTLLEIWNEQHDFLDEKLQDFKAELQDALERKVEDFQEYFSSIGYLVSGLTLAALAAGFLVSFWVVRPISIRLRHLNYAHQRWQEEDFDYRVEVKGDDELRALAVSGNKMARRLSELEDMKRDFISHISHELKSPLNSMLSAVRMMQTERAGEISRRQQKLLQGMQEAGDRLSRNIVNLLDFSRIEAGIFAVRTSAEDLSSVVGSYLDEVEPRIQEAGLELQRVICNDTVPVMCDRSRIQQVVANFLDNAIKFSPPQGAVEVSVQRHAQPPRTPSWAMGHQFAKQPAAVVCVSDAGPGVPAKRRAEIFTKFQQLESEHSRQGVGLGLAICRSIVEAHRGQIWVEESRLGGSRFCLMLPLDLPSSSQQD